MTDETPRPEPIAAGEPTTPPTEAPQPASRWRRPGLGRWSDRRVPLLVTGAALLLGCVLGAGAVAVGAAVSGDRHHGDDRGFHQRDGRDDARGDRDGDGGGGGRRDDRRQGDRDAPDSTPPSAPASAPAAPAPGASGQPSSPAPAGT